MDACSHSRWDRLIKINQFACLFGCCHLLALCLLACSPAHSFACPLNILLVCMLAHLLACLLACFVIWLLIHLLIHLLVCLLPSRTDTHSHAQIDAHSHSQTDAHSQTQSGVGYEAGYLWQWNGCLLPLKVRQIHQDSSICLLVWLDICSVVHSLVILLICLLAHSIFCLFVCFIRGHIYHGSLRKICGPIHGDFF